MGGRSLKGAHRIKCLLCRWSRVRRQDSCLWLRAHLQVDTGSACNALCSEGTPTAELSPEPHAPHQRAQNQSATLNSGEKQQTIKLKPVCGVVDFFISHQSATFHAITLQIKRTLRANRVENVEATGGPGWESCRVVVTCVTSVSLFSPAAAEPHDPLHFARGLCPGCVYIRETSRKLLVLASPVPASNKFTLSD